MKKKVYLVLDNVHILLLTRQRQKASSKKMLSTLGFVTLYIKLAN